MKKLIFILLILVSCEKERDLSTFSGIWSLNQQSESAVIKLNQTDDNISGTITFGLEKGVYVSGNIKADSVFFNCIRPVVDKFFHYYYKGVLTYESNDDYENSMRGKAVIQCTGFPDGKIDFVAYKVRN